MNFSIFLDLKIQPVYLHFSVTYADIFYDLELKFDGTFGKISQFV